MHDLQTFSSKILEKELGISVAQRIQKLSFGEDNSPVTPSGPPQVHGNDNEWVLVTVWDKDFWFYYSKSYYSSFL